MKKLLFLLLCAAVPTVTMGQDATTGDALFAQHCATCHGADARGNGPMAPVLMLQPSDLTQLTNRAGGTYPVSLLISKLDGRDPLLSHGSPMPIFGPFFEGKGVVMRGEDGVLIMTSQPIIDLVEYLRSMQAQPQ
ncbi:MAG: mono/diheme cytochrome c family protein [Yoonia sp.]|jgi:mono/diheme cytochrome c family protein